MTIKIRPKMQSGGKSRKMCETENLNAIFDEIQSIVSDQLQVVSYKWLSRNFSVSSNAAKILLHEFVEKYGNGIEVIYSVSGWLKDSPSTYHFRLASKHTLSDVKQEFNGNCSIQVYSIQACLPKDPATLWNQEFVQTEDLFEQPLTVDNCLRSNMFCGVSSSFIIRNVDGKASSTTSPQVKITEVSDLSKSNNACQTPSVPQPRLKNVQQPPNLNNVKIETRAKKEQGKNELLAPHKEKPSQVLPDKKKGQSDKYSSGSGSALASMWGRAPTKSKHDIPLEQPNDSRQKSAATADAQIFAREEVECESSDEDGRDFKVNRGVGGSRKRRVMLHYSDDDDEFRDAVNLASPDPPKKSTPVTMKSSVTEISLNFKEEKENKLDIKEVKVDDVKPNKAFIQEISDMNKVKKEEPPISDNISSHACETDDGKRSNVTNAGHKKQKVVKTRIDERGREVTEVVWKGHEPDTKPDIKPGKIVEKDTVNNVSTSFKPNFVRKSPAVGNNAPANQTVKTGNKKGGKKDPKPTDHKQGNILSFFKKA